MSGCTHSCKSAVERGTRGRVVKKSIKKNQQNSLLADNFSGKFFLWDEDSVLVLAVLLKQVLVGGEGLVEEGGVIGCFAGGHLGRGIGGLGWKRW